VKKELRAKESIRERGIKLAHARSKKDLEDKTVWGGVGVGVWWGVGGCVFIWGGGGGGCGGGVGVVWGGFGWGWGVSQGAED